MAEVDIERVLFTRKAIEARVSHLGREVAEDFAGRQGPIILGVLKGACRDPNSLSIPDPSTPEHATLPPFVRPIARETGRR